VTPTYIVTCKGPNGTKKVKVKAPNEDAAKKAVKESESKDG
jgi:hypothetical protein